MPEHRIADLFHIQSRFVRSVHLERDFSDPSALDGYVVTPQVQAGIERVTSGLRPGSGQRAWRITGDYGSGKSSFALVLARLLSGDGGGVPERLRDAVGSRSTGGQATTLLPILVTGSREPMSSRMLRCICHTLSRTRRRGRLPRVAEQAGTLLERSATQAIPDDAIVGLLQDMSTHVRSSGKATGVLLILDELGKFLEFAALHPDRQDIYLLQGIAEAAARSGESPILVVGLLHQGFSAYADELSGTSKREWEKVAGRFEEFLFDQPLEQTATLVASALDIAADHLCPELRDAACDDMAHAVDLGWYGHGTPQQSLVDRAPRLYPLHPTVLPVVVQLFRRFGQNERSLFSFLLSNEPFALQAFAAQSPRSDVFYRVHDLYDYARYAFGHRLSVQSYRSHWNQIESVIESFPADQEIEARVLKTVAVLNLLDVGSLSASSPVVELAVAGSRSARREQVRAAVKRLQQTKRVLYYRGTAGGYCLWPHTSVNLDRAYDEASEATGILQRVSPFLRGELETRPLVARRHYIETGNLRHFEVKYATVDELSTLAGVDLDAADGRILVPLCETPEERLAARHFASSDGLKEQPALLVAVPKPLGVLAKLMQECKRWEWIERNVPELGHDPYAAEEVSRQIAAAREVLRRRLEGFIGLRQFADKTELEWFSQGHPLPIGDGRELLSHLSRICDEVYDQAPRMRNELVNRRALSSAAAAARTKLIERILTAAGDDLLGMGGARKPPEMSMYLSVLRAANLHRRTKMGHAVMIPPPQSDPSNVRPVLKRMLDILEERPGRRHRVSEVFAMLRRPPYGVRDGLSPLLLAVFAVVHERDIAFYEDGSFVRSMSGDVFHRIAKAPDTFEMQYCRIGGVRAVLFNALLKVILSDPLPDGSHANVLDVVRPLCLFAARLPVYTQKTRQLPARTLAVRDAVLAAREPGPLIFRDIPVACGFQPLDDHRGRTDGEVHRIAGGLKDALDDLRAAYPKLIEAIRAEVVAAFGRPGSFREVRDSLADASERILVAANDPQLRAFCLRLADGSLEEQAWLEALGSFLVSKPPSGWTDSDTDRARDELYRLAELFKRVESVNYPGSAAERGAAMRLAITFQDGTDIERVVHLAPNEVAQASEMEAAIARVLERNSRVGVAAASRAIWRVLAQSGHRVEGPGE